MVMRYADTMWMITVRLRQDGNKAKAAMLVMLSDWAVACLSRTAFTSGPSRARTLNFSTSLACADIMWFLLPWQSLEDVLHDFRHVD